MPGMLYTFFSVLFQPLVNKALEKRKKLAATATFLSSFPCSSPPLLVEQSLDIFQGVHNEYVGNKLAWGGGGQTVLYTLSKRIFPRTLTSVTLIILRITRSFSHFVDGGIDQAVPLPGRLAVPIETASRFFAAPSLRPAVCSVAPPTVPELRRPLRRHGFTNMEPLGRPRPGLTHCVPQFPILPSGHHTPHTEPGSHQTEMSGGTEVMNNESTPAHLSKVSTRERVDCN